MTIAKLQKVLSSDEVEARAIERGDHRPSFIKAASCLGEESIPVAKLSELPLRTRARAKLVELLGFVR